MITRTTRSPIAVAAAARASEEDTTFTWRASRFGSGSIRYKPAFVTCAKPRVLRVLREEAIADRQHLDVGPHETAEGVLGRFDDRLAAHVERRIDEHGA